MDTNWCLSNASSEVYNDFYSENLSGDEETEKNDKVSVGDITKHEPLNATHGAQLMDRQYKQEKKELKGQIAVLEARCNAKDKEIALLQEIGLAKDVEIADLQKETILELQQNGQTTVLELPEQKKQKTEIDFVEQMKTIDEELKKTKKNICQAKGNLLKQKAEVANLCREPQLFNVEDYFNYPQPSWFDTLSNNIGCLQIDNYPVRAKDLDTNRTGGSDVNTKMSKSTEAQSCRPPLFTPVNSAATSQYNQNNPVAATTGDSQKRPVNPLRKAAAKGKRFEVNHPPVFTPVNSAALTSQPDQNTPLIPVFNCKKTSNPEKSINPLRKTAKGRSQQMNHPSPVFTPLNGAAVPSQVVQNIPLIPVFKNAEAKVTGNSQKPINPFSKATKGRRYLHQRPLPPCVPVARYPMSNAYPAYGFVQLSCTKPFLHIEQQGFLSRTFGKLFGSDW